MTGEDMTPLQVEPRRIYPTFTSVWADLGALLLSRGDDIAPRGQQTKEITAVSLDFKMVKPVLVSPARNLNYKFMAAEAHWILSGSDRLADIYRYNTKIADYSDDGVTMAGAYGPRVVAQLDWAVQKLLEDPFTRQSVISIWRPSPAPSKDIPCTLSLQFFYRSGRLNTVVTMRSSDFWLGLPYDAFVFTMVTASVAAKLREIGRLSGDKLSQFAECKLGAMTFNLGSSHVYQQNFDDAKLAVGQILQHDQSPEPEIPVELYDGGFNNLLSWLDVLRHSRRGSVVRWWGHR